MSTLRHRESRSGFKVLIRPDRDCAVGHRSARDV